MADFDLSPRLPELDQVRKFVILVLSQVQQDQATELVIEQPVPGGHVPIRYLVEGTWYDMEPFPAHIRGQVAQAIIRMAKSPVSARFPIEGDINEFVTGGLHLHWHVTIADPDAPVRLHRLFHDESG